MILGVPRSPRWLTITANNHEEALKILKITHDNNEAETKLDEIKKEINTTEKNTTSVFKKKYNFPLLLAFLVAFFNQLSGINFLLYYAPEIFGRAGIENPFLASVYVGVANLIFTILGMSLIDKFGRKQLLIIGSIGYIISLSVVAWAFKVSADAVILLTFIILFVVSHAIGQGAIIWVFISEIFPNKVRAMGNSFGCGTHWVFAAIITLITPVFLDKNEGIFNDNPWPIFAFFAFMMVLQLAFALFIMPETKGISLEDLSKKLVKDETN